MLGDLWQQVLAAFGLAFAAFVPWALARYRDRQSREQEVRFWQVQARAWRDLTANYRTLVNRRVIEDSDVDDHLKNMNSELEKEFDRLTEVYQAGPAGKKTS